MRIENLYGAFSNALNIIVNSETPIFKRITNAFQVSLAKLDTDILPEEIKQRFLVLKRRFDSNEPIFELDEALTIVCEIIDMAEVIRIAQYSLDSEKELRRSMPDHRKISCHRVNAKHPDWLID